MVEKRRLGPFIKLFFTLILPVVFLNCNSGAKQKDASIDNKDSIISPPTVNPVRENIQKEAVVSYSEKTENPLNDWYFRVQLFETEKTFHYLVKLQYEEIRGTDTIKLPDFGVMPEPVIQKGTEKFSCVIGFLDKEKKFREYKKVYVKDNHLKITTLRHYGVRVYPVKTR